MKTIMGLLLEAQRLTSLSILDDRPAVAGVKSGVDSVSSGMITICLLAQRGIVERIVCRAVHCNISGRRSCLRDTKEGVTLSPRRVGRGLYQHFKVEVINSRQAIL